MEENCCVHNALFLIKKSYKKRQVRRRPEYVPVAGDLVKILNTTGGRKKIFFQNREYDIISFGKGKQGSVMTICIKVENDFPFNVWIIYTNTPTAK